MEVRRPSRQGKASRRPEARPVIPPAPAPIPDGQACCCYIVECCDGTLYTGWAMDVERRLKVHNAGRGARYTSMRRPVRLVYVELQPDRTAAMKRERAIKKLTRRQKLSLIQGHGVQA